MVPAWLFTGKSKKGMPGGAVGIYAQSHQTNLLRLPLDDNAADASLRPNPLTPKANGGGVQVALVTGNPAFAGENSAYFDRNCLYYTPRTGAPAAFVLAGNFCVHGFVCSNQTGTSPWNTILSVGHVSHGGILFRPGSTIGATDDVYVAGSIVYRGLIQLFPRNVWKYFALSRSAGRLRLHTAARDAGGNWVVTEHALIAGTETNAAVINPSNRGVYVGASFHKEAEGLPDERFLGWALGVAAAGGAQTAWTAFVSTGGAP